MNGKMIICLAISIPALLVGCSAEQHAGHVQNGIQGDRVTVGTVQKEIHKGMSGSEVMEALGSPNVVSTDENGNEVWVYDKFATDVAQSSSNGWFIVGSASSGASSKSQRTLTIIIKFDGQKKVRDFAYHSSRF